MKSIRSWWPVPSVLGGLLVLIVLLNVPGGRTILRFLPPVGIVVLGLICFGDLARRDRPAFISVVGPAFVLALVSIVSAGPLRYSALVAVGFLAVFVFAPLRVWPWWLHHVLRRRAPTAGQRFDRRLAVELRAWSGAIQRANSSDVLAVDAADAARRALTRLRALTPPDADWVAIQDAYITVGERWVLLARHEIPAEIGYDLQRDLDALAAERRELRART